MIPIISLAWKGKVNNQNNPSPAPPPPKKTKQTNKYKKKKQREIEGDYIERKEHKSKISDPNANF